MHYCKKQKVVTLLIIFFTLFSGFNGLIQSQGVSLKLLPEPNGISLSVDELIQKRTSIREF